MGFKDLLVRGGLISDGTTDGSKETKKLEDTDAGNQQPVFHNSSRQPARPIPSTSAPARAISAEVDQKYVQSLTQALEKSRVRGYSELLAQLGIFMKVPGMTESMRFQAALVQLETDGISRADIVRSIEDRLALLEGQRMEFSQTVDSRRQSVIGAKSAEKESKKQQIEEMERRIQKLRQELVEIDVQVEEEESKLSIASAAFEGSYTVVEKDIRDLLTKVNSHLS
jgi:hypothetical protein